MNANIPFFEVELPLTPEIDDGIRRDWRKFVNLYYTGKESIPLSETVSLRLKEAHWSLNLRKVVRIRVKLYADGSLKI